MTKPQCKKKILEIFHRDRKYALSLIDKALNSGALDLKSYDNNYIAPKIVKAAIYKELANKVAFPSKPERHHEAIRNLRMFL